MNQQPNVLFLFTDQQRADTIYAPGKPRRLVTPALRGQNWSHIT